MEYDFVSWLKFRIRLRFLVCLYFVISAQPRVMIMAGRIPLFPAPGRDISLMEPSLSILENRKHGHDVAFLM